MKLVEIAQGWANLVRSDQRTREEALRRLEVCDSCPEKKQLSPAGQLILGIVNESSSKFKCGKCGCPLSAKALSPDSKCPLGKWEINTHDHG